MPCNAGAVEVLERAVGGLIHVKAPSTGMKFENVELVGVDFLGLAVVNRETGVACLVPFDRVTVVEFPYIEKPQALATEEEEEL